MTTWSWSPTTAGSSATWPTTCDATPPLTATHRGPSRLPPTCDAVVAGLPEPTDVGATDLLARLRSEANLGTEGGDPTPVLVGFWGPRPGATRQDAALALYTVRSTDIDLVQVIEAPMWAAAHLMCEVEADHKQMTAAAGGQPAVAAAMWDPAGPGPLADLAACVAGAAAIGS